MASENRPAVIIQYKNTNLLRTFDYFNRIWWLLSSEYVNTRNRM